MPSRRDVRLARSLIRQHFGHHGHPGGIYPSDAAINAALLGNTTPIPEQLGKRHFRAFFSELGVRLDQASDAYLNKFRDNCIIRMMGAELGGAPPTVDTIARMIAKDVADRTWD